MSFSSTRFVCFAHPHPSSLDATASAGTIAGSPASCSTSSSSSSSVPARTVAIARGPSYLLRGDRLRGGGPRHRPPRGRPRLSCLMQGALLLQLRNGTQVREIVAVMPPEEPAAGSLGDAASGVGSTSIIGGTTTTASRSAGEDDDGHQHTRTTKTQAGRSAEGDVEDQHDAKSKRTRPRSREKMLRRERVEVIPQQSRPETTSFVEIGGVGGGVEDARFGPAASLEIDMAVAGAAGRRGQTQTQLLGNEDEPAAGVPAATTQLLQGATPAAGATAAGPGVYPAAGLGAPAGYTAAAGNGAAGYPADGAAAPAAATDPAAAAAVSPASTISGSDVAAPQLTSGGPAGTGGVDGPTADPTGGAEAGAAPIGTAPANAPSPPPDGSPPPSTTVEDSALRRSRLREQIKALQEEEKLEAQAELRYQGIDKKDTYTHYFIAVAAALTMFFVLWVLRTRLSGTPRKVAMVALFYLSGILMYVIGDAADWVDAYFSVNSAGVDVRDVAGKVKPPILDCIVEGLWFATMVFTTIGYGDVYPESSALRLFEVFYVLLGVGVMGSLVADVVTSQVESSLKAFEKRQLAAALQGVGVDSSSVGRTTPGRMGEQDAEAAIAGARARMAFQEGATIVVGLILGFALLFGGLQGWEPMPALHWATITLSTVGWGDLDVDTRVTRVLGIVLFPPGVAIFAYGLGKIAGVLLDDGEDEDGHDGLGVERITLHQALGMDRDGNKAVDKFEFATGCLLASGRLSEEDLASIMNRFRQLDRDGSGLLTVDDVVPTSLMPGGGELAGGTARGAAEVGAAQRTVVEQAAAGSLESGTSSANPPPPAATASPPRGPGANPPPASPNLPRPATNAPAAASTKAPPPAAAKAPAPQLRK